MFSTVNFQVFARRDGVAVFTEFSQFQPLLLHNDVGQVGGSVTLLSGTVAQSFQV